MDELRALVAALTNGFLSWNWRWRRRGKMRRSSSQPPSSDLTNLNVEKRPTGLGSGVPRADQVPGHSPLGHIVAEQGQFRYDPQCSPGPVLSGHAANQVTDSRSMDGRPGFLPRDFQRQYNLNPWRCQRPKNGRFYRESL